MSLKRNDCKPADLFSFVVIIGFLLFREQFFNEIIRDFGQGELFKCLLRLSCLLLFLFNVCDFCQA